MPPPTEEHPDASEDATDGGLPCGQDSECPPGQGCVATMDGRRCQPPDCVADEDCLASQRCRVMNHIHLGPPVRRCVALGVREEGEVCFPSSVRPETTCGPGLRCSNLHCGYPCVDGGCPAARTCADDGNGEGPVCLISCEAVGCPPGQTCVGMGGSHQCVEAIGKDCFKEPCPGNEQCQFSIRSSGRTLVARFQCKLPCDPLTASSCPDGSVCGAGVGAQSVCFLRCDPDREDAGCPGPDMYCAAVTEDGKTFGCRR